MTRPLSVVLANNIYPPVVAGGAELIVSWLAEGLAARGHRVTVVSTCAPEMEPHPSETRNGVEVVRFFPPNLYWSFTRDRAPGWRKAAWHLRDAWNRRAGERFAEVLRVVRPDLVHTHLIDGMSAAVWGAARRSGAPVVHTAHDYHLLCPRAFLLTREGHVCARPGLACQAYRAWHLGTTRLVDLFASPSHFLLDRHGEAGLRAGRLAVVPNGIPGGDREVVRAARSPGARARFLMLTRLTEEKGVRVVLDAMARLPRELPVELAIAGTGPLEGLVREAAAGDLRIRVLGYVAEAEKRAALAWAGTLLLPSLWWENAPVAIIEAASGGLAVIGSRMGGIPEFVREGLTGLLVPPGDAGALAEAMRRRATEPGLLAGLDAATATLAAEFTVGRMVDAYEAEYWRLCRDGSVARAVA